MKSTDKKVHRKTIFTQTEVIQGLFSEELSRERHITRYGILYLHNWSETLIFFIFEIHPLQTIIHKKDVSHYNRK